MNLQQMIGTVFGCALSIGATLVPDRVEAQPLIAAERGGAALLSMLGESPLVLRAIESTFGAGSRQALRYFSMPAAERGLAALGDNKITAEILSGSNFTESQKLAWASTVNTLRLTEPSAQGAGRGLLASRAAGEPSVAAELVAPKPGAEGVVGATRSWSISPLGDVKIDPGLKVPLFRYKANEARLEITTVPAGKIGLGTAACIEASCIAQLREYLGRTLNADTKASTQAE